MALFLLKEDDTAILQENGEEILLEKGQIVGTSYVKVNQFDTDELAEGTTPAHASNNITLDNTGVMQFSVSLSFSGTKGVDYYAKIFVDGVEIDGFTSKASLIHGTDLKVLKIDGIYPFTATEVVDVRVKTSAGGSDFLVHEGSFLVASMGAAGTIGATGESLYIDDSDVEFTEAERSTAETAGSPSDRYVITVKEDQRDQDDRDAGPGILNFDLIDQMLATDGTDWFLYGRFKGTKGLLGSTPTVEAVIAAKGPTGPQGPTPTAFEVAAAKGPMGPQGPIGQDSLPGEEGLKGRDGPMGSVGNAADGGYKAWDAPGEGLDDVRIHYGVFNQDQSSLFFDFDVGQLISKYAQYTRQFRPSTTGIYKFSIMTTYKMSDHRRWIWIDLQRKDDSDWIAAQELSGEPNGGLVQVRQDLGFFRAQTANAKTGAVYDPCIQHDYLLRELKADVNYRLRIWVSHFFNSSGINNRPLRNLGEDDRNQQHTIVNPSNAKTGVVINLLTAFVNGVSNPPDPPAPPITGCTDPSANNYNPQATIDDGSCEFDPVPDLGNLYYSNTSSQSLKLRDSTATRWRLDLVTGPTVLFPLARDSETIKIWATDFVKVTAGNPDIVVRVYRDPIAIPAVAPTTLWAKYISYTTDGVDIPSLKRQNYHYSVEIEDVAGPPQPPPQTVFGKVYYRNGSNTTALLKTDADGNYSVSINAVGQPTKADFLFGYTDADPSFVELWKDFGSIINSTSLVVKVYYRTIGNTSWTTMHTFIGFNTNNNQINLLQPGIRDYLIEIQGSL